MLRRDPSRRRAQRGSRSPVRRERAEGSNESDSRARTAARDPRVRAAQIGGFTLYVEGARDREILACWARRAAPAVVRCIEHNTVILGGRRPARAVSDFRRRGGREAGHRGLVVLDRDHHDEPPESVRAGPLQVGEEPGLELFVWGLRHIESYLLVPAAIRRLLDLEADDQRVERAIARHLEAERVSASHVVDGAAASVHAKRILGARGSLTEALGAELRAGDIARTMRADELHDDVHALFGRIGRLAGLSDEGPEVVIRAPRRRS